MAGARQTVYYDIDIPGLQETGMPLFLLGIFGVYSAVHVYVFLRLRSAFPFGHFSGTLIGLFMAAMILSPIMVRLIERSGYETPARLLSYLGYTWMGVIFLFFCLSLLTDFYRLALYGTEALLFKGSMAVMPSAKAAFLIPLLLALAISLYGYFEARDIRMKSYTVHAPNLPETIGRLRIAQISDVHLGLIVREERLGRIIKAIREANPDILVSTGDLVDGQIDSLTNLADALKEIRPRYGKYAVTGNHEFYAGLPQALEITKRAGFTVLRNEAAVAGGLVNIVGIDDPTAKQFGLAVGEPERDLLARLPRDRFTVLLKHQPIIRGKSIGLYDLQLSGHTHKGQIFPFRLLVGIFYPYVTGWHAFAQGSHLYVSPGTGTWGAPIRFLAQPEVTVIDLVRRQSSSVR